MPGYPLLCIEMHMRIYDVFPIAEEWPKKKYNELFGTLSQWPSKSYAMTNNSVCIFIVITPPCIELYSSSRHFYLYQHLWSWNDHWDRTDWWLLSFFKERETEVQRV